MKRVGLQGRMLAGTSSFGMSGVNSHLLLMRQPGNTHASGQV